MKFYEDLVFPQKQYQVQQVASSTTTLSQAIEPTVILPSPKLNEEPSNVKFASPFTALLLEAVTTLLSAPSSGKVIPPPLAASQTAFEPSHLRN